MKTDDLIKGLAADTIARTMPMRQAWTLATLAAVVLAAVVFLMLLGPRPDIASAMQTGRFLFKFVVTAIVALTAWRAVGALARPEGDVVNSVGWLMAGPLVLAAAVVAELFVLPPADWMPRMVGRNNMLCLLAIPAIGALPLAIILAVMRHGAPSAPGISGATAGVLAGGIAATFYAAHCFDDSPLFVALWYSLAIAILALVGAAAGRRLARW